MIVFQEYNFIVYLKHYIMKRLTNSLKIEWSFKNNGGRTFQSAKTRVGKPALL